eukprot:gene19419-29921_t
MFRRSLCLRRPLAVGDRATGPERVFGKADLEAFLAVAGDTNTVHRTGDETVEGGAVLLPGMMVASLISGVMGSQLPGPGSLYLSQKLNFRRPAQVGEALRAEVNVTALSPSRSTPGDIICSDQFLQFFNGLGLARGARTDNSERGGQAGCMSRAMVGGTVSTKFKVVLLGDSGVGKSSLVARLIDDDFSHSQRSTTGASFLHHTVELEDCTVNLDIWDTAGQERYR